MTRLRVGVVGAGSIGCYLGGRLLAAGAADVVLVGRARIGAELAEHGLTMTDAAGTRVVPAGEVRFATELAAVAGCDAILCCVKSGDTDAVGAELATALAAGTVVASLQNGVRNADVLRARLPAHRVLAGIVGFNVVSRGGGVFHRGTSGPIMLESGDERSPRAVADALTAAGLEVKTRADLAPDQWTKLLVNLNNAVSALSGAPTRDIILSPALRRIVAAIVREALAVLRAAKLRPARLRGVPVGWMPAVLGLPTPIVRLVTRSQMKVDPEARSSMWEDLERGRPTEVDHLNGEIVRLGERAGVDAPLNRRIVELVHAAERTGPGSPRLEAAALWSALTAT